MSTEISLSPRAASEFKRMVSEQVLPHTTCLRLSVMGGGCSGFMCVVDMVEGPNSDDQVFESHHVRIACDPLSFLYLEGTTVDFEDDVAGRGFVFNNPNAKSHCQCALSFGI